MATPPRSVAEKSLSEPSSLPIGVRAPLTMTDPGIGDLPSGALALTSDLPAAGRRAVTGRTPARGRHATAGTCSPASTTWASPSPTSTPRSPCTPGPSACAACTRRSTRSRACGRRCSRSATGPTRSSCSRRCGRTPRSRSSWTGSGPGIQQVAYTVDDVEAVAATLRERGLRVLYDDAAARHRRLPGQLRAPQGRRRRPRRAGRAGPLM